MRIERKQIPRSGWDTPLLLRQLASDISMPLCYLFNQSLKEGRIPDDWRTANITAIFKKGDRKAPGNYRPVSLTSILCKLMEQFVKESIVEHITLNKLVCEEQHGFVKGKSCVTNLLETIDSWTTSIDNNQPVDAIYLDFRKAFDKVPHKRLVAKLKLYDIDHDTVRWVEDFLTNRKQRVVVNGTESDWRSVSSGIPQGSVLGPILFIIYINDLPQSIDSDSKIFADDTKVYRNIDSSDDRTKLQNDINSLEAWSQKWQIEFNIDKCSVVHIGKDNAEYDYFMTINNVHKQLSNSDGEKDLGVLVDKKLNFNQHIEKTVNAANKTLGVLKRNFRHTPQSAFITLYKTLVRSKLEYANVIWHPTLEKDKDKVERVQRRATKCIKPLSNLRYTDRLRCLNLPTLEFRRLRGDLLQAHKIVHGNDNVKNLFNFNNSSITRGHSLKMEKRRCRTNVRKNFFSNRIVNPWNSLPNSAVTAQTLNSLKNQIDSSTNLGDKFSYKHW